MWSRCGRCAEWRESTGDNVRLDAYSGWQTLRISASSRTVDTSNQERREEVGLSGTVETMHLLREDTMHGRWRLADIARAPLQLMLPSYLPAPKPSALSAIFFSSTAHRLAVAWNVCRSLCAEARKVFVFVAQVLPHRLVTVETAVVLPVGATTMTIPAVPVGVKLSDVVRPSDQRRVVARAQMLDDIGESFELCKVTPRVSAGPRHRGSECRDWETRDDAAHTGVGTKKMDKR